MRARVQKRERESERNNLMAMLTKTTSLYGQINILPSELNFVLIWGTGDTLCRAIYCVMAGLQKCRNLTPICVAAAGTKRKNFWKRCCLCLYLCTIDSCNFRSFNVFTFPWLLSSVAGPLVRSKMGHGKKVR